MLSHFAPLGQWAFDRPHVYPLVDLNQLARLLRLGTSRLAILAVQHHRIGAGLIAIAHGLRPVAHGRLLVFDAPFVSVGQGLVESDGPTLSFGLNFDKIRSDRQDLALDIAELELLAFADVERFVLRF